MGLTQMVRIRLTRKLALVLNGIDVSHLNVGDVMELPPASAKMMVAEGWAAPVDEPEITHLLVQHATHSEIVN
jgi:hypothetical protein